MPRRARRRGRRRARRMRENPRRRRILRRRARENPRRRRRRARRRAAPRRRRRVYRRRARAAENPRRRRPVRRRRRRAREEEIAGEENPRRRRRRRRRRARRRARAAENPRRRRRAYRRRARAAENPRRRPRRRRVQRRRLREGTFYEAYGAGAAQSNPTVSWIELGVAVGGTALGYFLAQGVDRFVATMPGAGETEAKTGAAAIAAINSPPTVARVIGQGAVSVAGFAGAWFVPRRFGVLQALLGGVGLGAAAYTVVGLINWFLVPPILRTTAFGKRLWPAEIAASPGQGAGWITQGGYAGGYMLPQGNPYGYMAGAYGGAYGGVYAPAAVSDYGPVAVAPAAVPAGAVAEAAPGTAGCGCGQGCTCAKCMQAFPGTEPKDQTIYGGNYRDLGALEGVPKSGGDARVSTSTWWRDEKDAA